MSESVYSAPHHFNFPSPSRSLVVPQVVKASSPVPSILIYARAHAPLPTPAHPTQLENALTAMFQIAKSSTGPPRPANASPSALDFLDCCLRVDPLGRPSAAQLLQHPWLE